MTSKFIKGDSVECLSCGSRLLRKKEVNGIERVTCFLCGAGELAFEDGELDGLDYQETLTISGREHGRAWQILPRLHTPGYNGSQTRFSERDIALLEEIFEGK